MWESWLVPWKTSQQGISYFTVTSEWEVRYDMGQRRLRESLLLRIRNLLRPMLQRISRARSVDGKKKKLASCPNFLPVYERNIFLRGPPERLENLFQKFVRRARN